MLRYEDALHKLSQLTGEKDPDQLVEKYLESEQDQRGWGEGLSARGLLGADSFTCWPTLLAASLPELSVHSGSPHLLVPLACLRVSVSSLPPLLPSFPITFSPSHPPPPGFPCCCVSWGGSRLCPPVLLSHFCILALCAFCLSLAVPWSPCWCCFSLPSPSCLLPA